MRFLIDGAERILDARVTDVVVGRPVRFHADPARDARAGDRLRQALDNAELNGCKLQLEPVAAAHSYERGLDSDRTVLVGDFGGGTADFAVLKVGPGRVGGDRLKDVLGTAGVAQAGDVLDGRFMETYLMPYFGRGTPLIPKYSTAEEPWQHPVHRKIQRLYDLHRLRTDDLQRRLEALEPRMVDTRPIRRLRRLVFDDLGYPLAWAIEHSKRTLSDTSHTTFAFGDFFIEELDIHHPVDVDSFAEGCQEQLSAYRKATLDAVRTAGLTPDRVDDIFLTGGTSQLPFIRGLYADLFGAERIATADAFTSVCAGLALS
jgi:hypothetical chaperone protein